MRYKKQPNNMGAGKGKQKRISTSGNSGEQWPRTPILELDGTLKVTVEGQRITEQGKFYPCPDGKLWISDEYSSPNKIADHVNKLLMEAPRRLREAVQNISVFGSYAPTVKTGFIGAACVEEQDLMVWRVQANHNLPGLRQDIIDHELAHLAGENGGPPPKLRNAWAKARKKDKKHGAKLAPKFNQGETAKGELKIGHVIFLLGEPWITLNTEARPSINRENEDWANTVSYYSAFKRMPQQSFDVCGKNMTFEDLWPYPAQLSSQFLDF